MMRRHLLETRVLVRAPLDRAWAFFSDPGNLPRITPPDLGFEIVTPPPYTMAAGARFDYAIRLLGMQVGWTSQIEECVPGQRFVDVQLRGPYRYWRHEHGFAAADADGTWVFDRVEYEVPFWPLGEIARRIYVHRSLEKIFRFRQEAVTRLLEGDRGGSGIA